MNAKLTRSRALLGVLLLAAAATATAGTHGSGPELRVMSLEVEYTDLDLATTAGAQALYKRIAQAAQTVCGPMNPRSARIMSAYRTCYQAAVTGAVEKVDAPTLTALHRHRSLRQASG